MKLTRTSPALFSSVWLLLTAMVLAPAAVAELVHIKPQLEVGQVKELTMTSSRTRASDQVSDTAGSATTDVRVEVISTGDQETVFGWEYVKTHLPPQLNTDERTKRLLKLSDGLRIEMAYDAQFNAQGVTNLNQVMKGMEAIWQELSADMDGTPEEEATKNQLKATILNPQFVEQTMSQKPAIYFRVFGWALEPGQPIEQEIQLGNPLGGNPLPAHLKTELKPFADNDEVYHIRLDQAFDQDAVGDFILELMQQYVPPEQQDKFPKDMVFDMQVVTEYQVDRETGWPVRVEMVKTVTVIGATQVERIVYELK